MQTISSIGKLQRRDLLKVILYYSGFAAAALLFTLTLESTRKPIGLPCETLSVDGPLQWQEHSAYVEQGPHAVVLAYLDARKSYVEEKGPMRALKQMPAGAPIHAETCMGKLVRVLSNGTEIFRVEQADVDRAATERRTTQFFWLIISSLMSAGSIVGIRFSRQNGQNLDTN